MKRGAVAFQGQSEMSGGAASLDVDLDVLRPAQAARSNAMTRDVADMAARTIVIALFTVMAARIGMDYMQTGRLTGLLLLASEALVVVLTMFRRAPVSVDRSAQARVLTAFSVMGPPLVRPIGEVGIAPEVATVLISAAGLLIVIAGKLSLGRSFGLMPANRGIVCSGLYRSVRHPIYLGYLLTHVAFVAANPTVWNMLLLLTADTALLARAHRARRVLVGRPPQSRDRRAEVTLGRVPERFDERMAIEHRLHHASLDAPSTPMNQPDFPQPLTGRRVHILFHHRRHIFGSEAMKVERVFDGDAPISHTSPSRRS
jgi:hypothetical protein